MKTISRPSGFANEFSLPSAPRMESWDDADDALAALGKLERKQALLLARRAQAVERFERRAEQLEARAHELASALEAFSRAQAIEATDRNGRRTTVLAPGCRSRRLVFGRLGFRCVHQLIVRDPERAVTRLARNGLGEKFLRVETQLDRDALHHFLVAAPNGAGRRLAPQAAGLAAARRQLARAGIRLETRDAWFYELHPRAIARWA